MKAHLSPKGLCSICSLLSSRHPTYEVIVMYKEFCQLHAPIDVAGNFMGWAWHSLSSILPVLPVLQLKHIANSVVKYWVLCFIRMLTSATFFVTM